MNSMGKSVRNSYILPARSASDFSFTQPFFLECSKADVWRKRIFDLSNCPLPNCSLPKRKDVCVNVQVSGRK